MTDIFKFFLMISYVVLIATLLIIGDKIHLFPSWTQVDVEKAFVSFFSVTIAAFLGAYGAFFLNQRNEKKNEIKKNVSNGNRMLYSLTKAINNLINIKVEIGNSEKSVFAVPIGNFESYQVFFDIENLLFLMKEDPELPFLLDVYKQNYDTILANLKGYSEYVKLEIRPILKKDGLEDGEEYIREKYESTLGPVVHDEWLSSSESLRLNIDTVLTNLIVIQKRVLITLQKLYKNEIFLSLNQMDK